MYLFIKKNETNEKKDMFDVAHLASGSHDKFPLAWAQPLWSSLYFERRINQYGG